MPPELLNDIGDALLVKQRSDETIELFRFNVAQHPNSAIAYDRQGRAYRTLKQHEPALKAYRKALDVDPHLLECRYCEAAHRGTC